MTPCQHHLADDPTALCCVREEGHPSGHTYDASSVPDGHDASEQRAEAERG